MTPDEVRDRLARAGFAIASDGRLRNETDTQIRLTNDAIVNVFDNGTVNCLGRNTDEVRAVLGVH
jgi:predicted nucleotide-binding protein